jgi:hypothetical protein
MMGVKQFENMSVEQFQSICTEELNVTQVFLNELAGQARILELSVSALHIDKIQRSLRSMNMQTILKTFGELGNMVQLELQTKTFMYIPQEKIKYFNDARSLFGQSTLDKFPSVISEVEEAGKCYAAGRNTATVFHLLRVTEAGLKAIAKELSIPTDTNRSWDSILKKIKSAAEVQHPRDEWTSFYTDLVGRMHAIKDAWRNPTMHIEKVYGSEEALDIFNVVLSFMRHLATKLNE